MKKLKFTITILIALLATSCMKIKLSPFDLSSDKGILTALAPFALIPVTVRYANSLFTLTQGLSIAKISPTTTGVIESCTANPALPVGLVIDQNTCAISGTPTATQAATAYTITASNAYGNGTANISIAVTPAAGTKYALSVGGVTFKMVYVPGKTTFTGTGDATTATVANAYTIAETEVTYQLWSTVHTWATVNGYTFASVGYQGNNGTVCPGTTVGTNQHPVTCINWRDAMVWTNALTEYYNAQNGTSYAVVYTSDAAYAIPKRDSRDVTCGATTVGAVAGDCDNPYVNPNAKGFRLPTAAEWELAARYKADLNSDGDIMDAGEYYPGSYASGGTAAYTGVATADYAAINLFAWFGGVNDGVNGNTISTQPVATKTANALGLFDMSGNVWEWDYDWAPNWVGTYREIRSGGWNDTALNKRVGHIYPYFPYFENINTGFRPARSP